MRTAVVSFVLAVITLGAVTETRADVNEEEAMRIARLAVQRTRRKIVLGPFLGVAPGQSIDAGEGHLGVVVGLDLSLFKVPVVPDSKTIKAIVQDRVKARLIEEVKAAALGGRTMTAEEQQTLAEDIAHAIYVEFMEERRGKRLEKPSIRAMLEYERRTGGDGWASRLTVAKGFSVVSLGPSFAVSRVDSTELAIGAEASVQVLLSRGPRSPVADLFFRYDFGVTDGSDDVISGGIRFVLDVI